MKFDNIYIKSDENFIYILMYKFFKEFVLEEVIMDGYKDGIMRCLS